jgi:serine protease AprX
MYIRFTVILSLFASLLFAQSEKIAPEVNVAFLSGKTTDIMIVLQEQADLSKAAAISGKDKKAMFVFDRLRDVAARSQTNLRQLLAANSADANSFYIVNAISVKGCTAELAQKVAALPEVKAISSDPWVAFPEPEKRDNLSSSSERNTIEWGVEKINAPTVWNMGFTGQGITVGGADTGYDWTHPAIRPHYRGYTSETIFDHNYNWHDAIKSPNPQFPDSIANPCGIGIPAPCDDNSHGTHTAGTMVGDDGQGNQIGVAPGAKWIGCRNMDRGWGQPSTYIECFEWFLAPTDQNGQSPNPLKSPHVINNSWYCSAEEGCTDLTINELMRTAVINLKASGVVVVVSNGNFGSQGCASTYGPPAYFEESFSVGSTQQNDTISNFSSRGPVVIDGSGRIKPNVSAPGQFVRSSVLNGNYAYYSGTSMAGPHVVGLVALLLSANPSLSGEVSKIEDIVESTCIPINGLVDCSDNNGLAYPNNTYGYGRVDALGAVEAALMVSTGSINPGGLAVTVFPNPVTDQFYLAINKFEGPVTFKLSDVSGNILINKPITISAGQLLQISTAGYPSGIYFWQVQTPYGKLSTGRLFFDKR